ncbi:hypothetical protein SH2C18_38630 [Clostridium sediminicola]
MKIAHENGIAVEGTIARNQLTNPNDAKYFVDKTGVDSLLINISKKHKDNEFYLDLVRLAEIVYLINNPLAMDCTNFLTSMIKRCIRIGISKVKVYTDSMCKRAIVTTEITRRTLKNIQNEDEEMIKDKSLKYLNVCTG